MPPASLNSPQTTDTGHMLPRQATSAGKQGSGIGATVGIIIIIVLVLFGALYFWGAYLNRKNSVEQLPFIPDNSAADTSTQKSE